MDADIYICLSMYWSYLSLFYDVYVRLQLIVAKASSMLDRCGGICVLKRMRYAYINQPMTSSSTGSNISTSSNTDDNKQGISGVTEIDAPFERPLVIIRLGQYLLETQVSIPMAYV